MATHTKETGVYFIQQGANGPIKIGQSKSSIASRLATIQGYSHEKVTLLAVAKDGNEAALHSRFRALHLRGEWFRPGKELLDFIAEVVNGAASGAATTWDTRGLKMLADVVSPPPPKWTKLKLAAALGVSHQAVWSWLSGKHRPDIEKRQQLEALLGIPVEAWDEPTVARASGEAA